MRIVQYLVRMGAGEAYAWVVFRKRRSVWLQGWQYLGYDLPVIAREHDTVSLNKGAYGIRVEQGETYGAERCRTLDITRVRLALYWVPVR